MTQKNFIRSVTYGFVFCLAGWCSTSICDAQTLADTQRHYFQLVDGHTGTPLQGMNVALAAAKMIGTKRIYRELGNTVTDSKGIISADFADGERPYMTSISDGWFLKSTHLPSFEVEQKSTTQEAPEVVKAWPGTIFSGQLLWPDGTPAAGVGLISGVYINNQTWKQRLDMSLKLYNFDHGDWANWSHNIMTDENGNFSTTVPPSDARRWVRIATVGMYPSASLHNIDEETTERLNQYVSFEYNIGSTYHGSSNDGLDNLEVVEKSRDHLLIEDIHLMPGVAVRGKVVDHDGTPLPHIQLISTGAHGSLSKRYATSDENGQFHLMKLPPGPILIQATGSLTRLRQQPSARSAQAVFVEKQFIIPESKEPFDITFNAVASVRLEFEWDDRRLDKNQFITDDNAFQIRGKVFDQDSGTSSDWTCQTTRSYRDGKTILYVNVPELLTNIELILPADSKVTASYEDSTGTSSGPGIVAISKPEQQVTRKIVGNESKLSRKPTEGPQANVQ